LKDGDSCGPNPMPYAQQIKYTFQPPRPPNSKSPQSSTSFFLFLIYAIYKTLFQSYFSVQLKKKYNSNKVSNSKFVYEKHNKKDKYTKYS